MTFSYAEVKSPVGALHLFSRDDALCGLAFADHEAALRARLVARFGAVAWLEAPDPAGAVTALGRYLDGRLDALDEVAVDAGGTPFQARVWAALRRIPAGETRSYQALARAVGQPGAVRAVGMANAQNPVSLIVPCHRVIRSDGDLCGYAGGVWRKRWLLAHEGLNVAAQLELPTT
jgi:methylated-DNA-[protein]-cysteine S-methyltransferase